MNATTETPPKYSSSEAAFFPSTNAWRAPSSTTTEISRSAPWSRKRPFTSARSAPKRTSSESRFARSGFRVQRK